MIFNVSQGDGGNYQDKTVYPSTSTQTIEADSGYSALETVTVNPITSTLLYNLDSDFVSSNIKNNINMFGLTGSYNGLPSTIICGDTPVALAVGTSTTKTSGSSWQDVGLAITIPKNGLYRIKRYCWRNNTGSGMGSKLVVTRTSSGSDEEFDAYTTWSGSSDRYHVKDYDFTTTLYENDVVTLYCKGTSSYVVNAAYLAACIDWTLD